MGNKIPYCFLFYNDENSDSKIDKINEVDLGDRKILQSVISSNEKGFSKNQTFEAQKFPLSSLKLNLVNYTFYPHGLTNLSTKPSSQYKYCENSSNLDIVNFTFNPFSKKNFKNIEKSRRNKNYCTLLKEFSIFYSNTLKFYDLNKYIESTILQEKVINFKNNLFIPLCQITNKLLNSFAIDDNYKFISFLICLPTIIQIQSQLMHYFKDIQVVVENRIICFFTSLKYTKISEIRISFDCEIVNKSMIEDKIIFEIINVQSLNEIKLIFRKLNFLNNQELFDLIKSYNLELKSLKFCVFNNFYSIFLTNFLDKKLIINENLLLHKISNFFSKILTLFKSENNISSYQISKILTNEIENYLKKPHYCDFCIFIKFQDHLLLRFGIKLPLIKEKFKSVFKLNFNNQELKKLNSIIIEYNIDSNTKFESESNLALKKTIIHEFEI